MATWDSADDDPGETEEGDVNDNDVNDHDFNNGDATETRIQRNPQLYNNGSCSDSEEVLKHKISAMLELIGKTVSCILCRGSTLYFDETGFQKFYRHLQFEHSAGAVVTVFNKEVPDQRKLQTASSMAATNDKSNFKKNPDAEDALANNFTMEDSINHVMDDNDDDDAMCESAQEIWHWDSERLDLMEREVSSNIP